MSNSLRSEDAPRTVGGRFRYRISLPYRRSLFFAPNASEDAPRTTGGRFRYREPPNEDVPPYHRRAFPAPNIPSVPQKVLRQISCCQVKQVWKILIQRSRSEARPYILLLIYFILLFRPSISPLLIEYFMAFLMGEMSRWTLFTKLTTSP